MNRPLIIGLMNEGPTDERLMSSVVIRTFEELIILESDELPDIYDVEPVESIKGSFVEKVVHAALRAEEKGITVLCIHTDSDSKTDKETFANKINPAVQQVFNTAKTCKFLVPIVPIHMSEAWMLADIDLLREEIVTDKSNEALELIKHPETYADPKTVIENALRIAQEGVAKRRKRYEVKRHDLYLPIGQKVDLNKLNNLSSYKKFRENVRGVLVDLKYIILKK